MRKRSWELQPGEPAFGALKVVAPLGGGRRTEVYRVWDTEKERGAVLKVTRPSALGPSSQRALEREAAHLGLLDHPGIPSLYDARPDAPASWLLMEEFPGMSVREHVRTSGPLSLSAGAQLLADTSDALLAIHEYGLVHLDLKPANMVTGRTYGILDLGGALTVESAALLRGVRGTWNYLSPEQARPGELGAPSPASDVWGLAISTLVAVSGRNPLRRPEEESQTGEEERLARGARRAARRLPGLLGELLYDCFATDPADRPTLEEIHALIA